MRNITSLQLTPFYTERSPNQDGFTLFIDSQTKEIYKAEFKPINELTYILAFVLVLILMRTVSVESIQFNNFFLFILLCFITILIGIGVGYYINRQMYINLRKISHQEEEWKPYIKKANNIYLRQIIYISILLILAGVCFLFFYKIPSIWWVFGGLSFSVFSGGEIQFLSKTRYRLYKNKIDFIDEGE
ncbi:MAG TPA: hypothetical protein VK072_07065 [Candidatus Avamphibacillus sp.]|nr:hypothetical protein [Candidatus Avamphibacillus sp.]